jgi:cell fate (sporulation/competence/biofilm development) regulator YmcA (YheA/YmcA/DUF963 family)
MNKYKESVNRLVDMISKHDSVIAFQKIEKKVELSPELEYQAHDMKAFQQDFVLFQRIGKHEAGKEANQQAEQLEKELVDSPLVQDYRNKMQDASDLLQYVTKTLEEKINKELTNDK